MGVNCKIVKDNFDNIVGVLAPNGGESILFNQALEYLTGKTISSIKNQNSIKQGVGAIFEQFPELSTIGTQEEYSQYVDAIFPDSQLKDVVYHGTDNEFDKFERGHTDRRGYKTNTIGFHFIEQEAIELYRETYGNIKAVVLNMQNPISTEYDIKSNESSTSFKLEFLNDKNRKEFESKGYDSGIILRQGEEEYITFEPEQIHILGTREDLDNFKKYKSGNIGSLKGNATQEEIEQALSVFGSAYTQGFQDFYTDEFFNTSYQTDINGEPILEDVLTYLKSTEEHRLNEVARMDFEDFKNQFPEMDYATLENKIYDAFLDENGNFVLDEQKLKDSGIYESQEIDNLLEDSALQESIKSNVLALNNEDFINTQDDNFLNIAIGEQYNSFGKLKTYDSYSLLNNILRSTVGAVTEEDFDTMLNQNVSEEVYNAIVDNKEMYDTLQTMAFNLKEIPVRTFENGSVNDVLERDIFNELKDTLILTNINPQALANLYTLTQLDYDVMLENLDEVVEMANTIESSLVSSNIDVIGLSNKIISDDIEKVQSFLRALNTFATSVNQGYVNDEMISAFSDVYTDFFNIENRTDLVDVESFDYDVVRINNEISKLDAYANGYLKIQDNNYIQVANASYDDIVTSLIDSYEIGENVLEGIVPNNLKSDIAYRNYIDSIVTSKINSFGEQINPTDLDAFKSIVLLEFLNGVENTQTNNFSNYVGEKQDLENKDLDYLAFDFPSDLNNIILLSKLNNSPLYEKIFQYLEFKNGEIKIKSNEEVVTSRIQNILPDDNKVLSELKDYFQPQVVEQSDYSIGKAEREYNFNNPSGLTFLNEGYTYLGDRVTTDLLTPDFIRTKEGVFERIDSIDGINIFSKLVAENGTVVISSLNKRIKGGATVENAVKFNNKYSQNQKGNILDDLTNCS